jgi:hypothetical protein
MYRIASKHETNDELYPLWWSNSEGWVEFEDSDSFDSIENLNLPTTGVWVHSDDYTYFESPVGYS